MSEGTADLYESKFWRFDPADYFDPQASEHHEVVVEDRSLPTRSPPIINLRWLSGLIHFIIHILFIYNWLQNQLLRLRHINPFNIFRLLSRSPALGPVAEAVPFPWSQEVAALWSQYAKPWWNQIQEAFEQFILLNGRPLHFFIGLFATVIYATVNLITGMLNLVLGKNRSIVNILDDSFDLQHCVQDLVPILEVPDNSDRDNTEQSIRGGSVCHRRRWKSAVAELLRTPDLLYPYDFHPHAGLAPIITPLDVIAAFISKISYENATVVNAEMSNYQWQLNFNPERDDFEYNNQQATLPDEFGDIFFQSRALLISSKDISDKESVVLAFRGTFPSAVVQWLTDMAAKPVPYTQHDSLVQVHRGFYASLGLPAVGDITRPQTLFTRLVQRLANPQVERVYIVGHSLGAALATLFAFAVMSTLPNNGQKINKKLALNTPATESEISEPQLRALLTSVRPKVKGVYVFGSPRVGNDQFCNKFDRLFKDIPVHRFINKGDVITRLPPPLRDANVAHSVETTECVSVAEQEEQYRQTSAEKKNGALFDYAHVDGLRFINGQNEIPHVVNQDAPPTPWTQLNIFDHNPGSYVRGINAALAQQLRLINSRKLATRLNKKQFDSSAALPMLGGQLNNEGDQTQAYDDDSHDQ